jgi:hypothetical protein
MNTERRDTPRIPAALETIINFNSTDYRPARTRDISLDGVFIEGSQHTVNERDHVDIAIRLPASGQSRFHRFQAKVIRTNRQGAGFVFDEVETDSYAALLEYVFGQQGRGL